MAWRPFLDPHQPHLGNLGEAAAGGFFPPCPLLHDPLVDVKLTLEVERVLIYALSLTTRTS